MTEIEIRKQTSPLMAKLILAVRVHARANGYGLLVEQAEDADLIPVIGYCRTETGAIAAVKKWIGPELPADDAAVILAAAGVEAQLVVLEPGEPMPARDELAARFGTDGAAAAEGALAEGADLDETPLTVEEEAAVDADVAAAQAATKRRKARSTSPRARRGTKAQQFPYGRCVDGDAGQPQHDAAIAETGMCSVCQ